jgi:hypothetical protein
MRVLEFRISDVLNFDHTRLEIYDTTVLAHHITPGTGRFGSTAIATDSVQSSEVLDGLET